MDRFEGAFHQSDLKAYLKCPRSFYYKRVLGLDREKVSLSSLAGRAGHEALEYAHLNNEWRPEVLNSVFLAALDKEKNWALDKGQDLHGNLDVNKYFTMLAEYAARPWNREAKVLALEAEFFFTIKPSKTEYQFAGRIDQLLEIPTGLLRAEFPDQFGQVEKDTVILHRDTKFGRRKECSTFELALDTQMDVYAYALKKGIFELADVYGPNPFLEKYLDLIPDFHVKYHLEDHIPYEFDGGPYLKDPDNGGRVPCDLVVEPCLVGKSQKACEGKRSWCTKQRRGPGMHFTTRPEARLDMIPAELGRVCASIRMGHYPRQLGELCFNYCQFRTTCEAEVMEGLAA